MSACEQRRAVPSSDASVPYLQQPSDSFDWESLLAGVNVYDDDDDDVPSAAESPIRAAEVMNHLGDQPPLHVATLTLFLPLATVLHSLASLFLSQDFADFAGFAGSNINDAQVDIEVDFDDWGAYGDLNDVFEFRGAAADGPATEEGAADGEAADEGAEDGGAADEGGDLKGANWLLSVTS